MKQWSLANSKYTFSSCLHGTVKKTDHVLDHKGSVNSYQINYSMQSVVSDHSKINASGVPSSPPASHLEPCLHLCTIAQWKQKCLEYWDSVCCSFMSSGWPVRKRERAHCCLLSWGPSPVTPGPTLKTSFDPQYFLSHPVSNDSYTEIRAPTCELRGINNLWHDHIGLSCLSA